MEIYHSIDEFAKTGYESQVALGFFDGVHLGHRTVLSECVVGKGDRIAAALTFRESPAGILSQRAVSLITDNEKKAELMEELGIDAVIFEDFSRIREMDAEEFITRVLYQEMRAKKVVCGYNYRFGARGAGDTALLREKCEALGIAVSVKEPVETDGKAVSSTAIRELLQSGELRAANRMLGYAFSIGGSIGAGNHLGSKMGFPTVNIPVGEGLVIPLYGVYAARVTVGGKTYRAATNIGVHPTVGASAAPLCESFLLDYTGEDLYGEVAVCELTDFIRPERRFDSGEALIAQVNKDIEQIRQI